MIAPQRPVAHAPGRAHVRAPSRAGVGIIGSLLLIGVVTVTLACALVYDAGTLVDDHAMTTDGEERCPDAMALSCGQVCVDGQSDPNHCGTCGRVCTSGEVCVEGECQEACPDGLTRCGEQCVALDSTAAHCGDCDVPCRAEEVCRAGTCVEECEQSCDDQTEYCQGGQCVCRDGFSRCEDHCVDLTNDPENCGYCDFECEEQGLLCGASQCVDLSCGSLPDRCGSTCTDVRSDPLHCGDCSTVCHSTEICMDSTCWSPG